jgi:hypothetical protein
VSAPKKRVWWTAAGAALLVLVTAVAFSAYLRPDMLVSFGDLMAFCAALIR